MSSSRRDRDITYFAGIERSKVIALLKIQPKIKHWITENLVNAKIDDHLKACLVNPVDSSVSKAYLNTVYVSEDERIIFNSINKPMERDLYLLAKMQRAITWEDHYTGWKNDEEKKLDIIIDDLRVMADARKTMSTVDYASWLAGNMGLNTQDLNAIEVLKGVDTRALTRALFGYFGKEGQTINDGRDHKMYAAKIIDFVCDNQAARFIEEGAIERVIAVIEEQRKINKAFLEIANDCPGAVDEIYEANALLFKKAALGEGNEENEDILDEHPECIARYNDESLQSIVDAYLLAQRVSQIVAHEAQNAVRRPVFNR